MKKKFLAVLAFALLLSLVLTVVVAAGDCEPPPCECSPGFWKNHTELWWSSYDPVVAEQMLANLKARGHGSGEIRHDVADELNLAFPDAPCD